MSRYVLKEAQNISGAFYLVEMVKSLAIKAAGSAAIQSADLRRDATVDGWNPAPADR